MIVPMMMMSVATVMTTLVAEEMVMEMDALELVKVMVKMMSNVEKTRSPAANH